MSDAPDTREQEDCPDPAVCGHSCDQHGRYQETDPEGDYYDPAPADKMTDHEPHPLTEDEREALGDWWDSDWPDTAGGVLAALYEVVGRIVAAHRAEVRAEFAAKAYTEWPVGVCAHRCFRTDEHVAPKDCLHGPDWLRALADTEGGS